MSHQFSEAERAVLRIVQADLPDTLTPYADMAREAGISEAEVLELLTRLKASGVIRRFGASIKHQKTGWTHNAMVAWKADEAAPAGASPPNTAIFPTSTTAPAPRRTGHTPFTPWCTAAAKRNVSAW